MPKEVSFVNSIKAKTSTTKPQTNSEEHTQQLHQQDYEDSQTQRENNDYFLEEETKD